jgi:hypothetical protein
MVEIDFGLVHVEELVPVPGLRGAVWAVAHLAGSTTSDAAGTVAWRASCC